MQKFLSKYAVAAHLALLAVSPLFLFPFLSETDMAGVVLWLCAFAALWVFLEPSRHADEMLHDARSRVVRTVLRDPLFWVFALIVLLVALRWINAAIEIAFDVETMRWYLKEPIFVALPGAAVGRGKFEFAMTLALWIVLTGIRHSLGKQARLSFVFTSAAFAALAATIAISAASLGNEAALTEAKALFKNPSFPGAVFAIYALASVVALAGSIEAKWNRLGWISALAIGGTLAGAFVFSPSVSALLYSAAVVLTVFIGLGWLGSVSKAVNALRFFAIFLIGVALATLLVICVAPDSIVEARVAEIQSLSLFPQNFAEVRSVLAKVAKNTWEEAKWLGSGLGTFSSQMRFVVDKADWKVLEYARPSAFSAWWTILAERGLVGVITLALPLAFLLFTFFRRIPGVFGNRFFAPGCWLGFAALAVAVTESFYDVSFLRPEALLGVAAFLSISAGSLPSLKNRGTSVDDDHKR